MSLLKLVSLILFIIALNPTKALIRCPLIWASVGAGENPPETAVPVHSEFEKVENAELFVAKTPTGYLGTYSSVDKKTYFTGPLSLVSTTTVFSILTNPHGCTLEWIYGGKVDGSHPVLFGSRYVGRGVAKFGPGSDTKLIGGYSTGNKNVVVPSTSSGYGSTVPGSILHSYSEGLDLKLRQIRMVNTTISPVQREFLGIDQIINNSPIRIIQSVSHESSLKEETLIVTQTKSSHTITMDAKLDIEIRVDIAVPGFVDSIKNISEGTGRYNKTFTPISKGISLFTPLNIENEDMSTIRVVKEAYVGISKRVEVEPYTSVQICSTVSIQSFSVDYEAVGVYSAKGLTGGEVQGLLSISGGTIVGNTVELPEKGTFSGTSPVATNFFVMPVNDDVGCHAVV